MRGALVPAGAGAVPVGYQLSWLNPSYLGKQPCSCIPALLIQRIANGAVQFVGFRKCVGAQADFVGRTYEIRRHAMLATCAILFPSECDISCHGFFPSCAARAAIQLVWNPLAHEIV